MKDFSALYADTIRHIKKEPHESYVSDELMPLMEQFYLARIRNPVDLIELRQTLLNLLAFLSSPRGRTTPNLRTVDLFIALGDWGVELPEVPDSFCEIIADLGAALHDSINSPHFALEYESTPEQLLERVKKLEVC